ncbi:MAG: HAMP domain-containing histidine kinase [Bdellovibrionales bacterium]|nr:HAMP domain-containing histidine kinase [Bdellovibrionales bacterium]
MKLLAIITVATILVQRIFPGNVFAGILITTLTVSLSLVAFFYFKKKNLTSLSLASLLFSIGDLAYGISVDVLHLDFPNKFGCLIYVLPYMGAMSLAIAIAYTALRSLKDKYLNHAAIILCIGATLISFDVIVVPALFHKVPELPNYLKLLTVLYTFLESAVIGLSITLLLVFYSIPIQMMLFGVLLMHVSDIALRYQSVDTSLLGIDFFTYGWTVGVLIIAVSSIFLKNLTAEKLKVVPIKSFRGSIVSTFFIGISISAFIFHSLQFGSTPTQQNASHISVFMIVVSVLYFAAILLTNILTVQFQEVVRATKNGTHKKSDLFYEIQNIESEIQSLSVRLGSELNSVKNRSSKLAHDIRSPIGALKMASSILDSLSKSDNVSKEDLQAVCEIVTNVNQSIALISKDVLNERKAGMVAKETIGTSVEQAVNIVSNSKPESEIEFELHPDTTEVVMPGLTRVLTNLINNSVESFSEEKAKVRVDTLVTRDEVILRITDKGSGIPKDVLNRLKSGESLTTKQDGNGIGLSSAIEWAGQHGLRFEINSNTGGSKKGTLIELGIPQ